MKKLIAIEIVAQALGWAQVGYTTENRENLEFLAGIYTNA